MKRLMILALGSMIAFSAQASQDSSKTERARQLAKRANGYLHSTMNEDEVSGNRDGDLFGSYGFNRCQIAGAVVALEGSRFTVTTPCGERYQTVVTGELGENEDRILSAKVELR